MVAHFREDPKIKNQSVLSLCCPDNHNRDAICLQEGGCGEREKPCLLLLVKMPWYKAGILTLSDTTIKRKLEELNSQYGMMCKHRNRKSKGEEQKREAFVIQIKKTWDIKHQNSRSLIENDPNRSASAKQEDLMFFDDYLGPDASRKWGIGTRDIGYDREQLSSLLSAEALENRRQERKRRQEALVEKERKRKQGVMEENELADGEEMVGGQQEQGGEQGGERAKGQKRADNDEEDSDWEDGRKESKKHRSSMMTQKSSINLRRKKGPNKDGEGGGDDGDEEDDDDGVWLKVPRNILKLTSLTAARRLLSLEDHTSILAAFLVASGGDLDDFTISNSSSHRLRKEAMEEVYDSSRESGAGFGRKLASHTGPGREVSRGQHWAPWCKDKGIKKQAGSHPHLPSLCW